MEDIIIIGMGISGITAGIYAKRANKKVLMFDGSMPGGILNNLDLINNYPGFSNVKGTDLAILLLNQVNELKIPYKNEKVIKLELDSDIKKVFTNTGVYETKNIILAMGRKPILLGLENEKDLFGKGLSTCATCDGNFYKNKDVAVVGQNKYAVKEALYLANIVKKVYLICLTKEIKINAELKKELLEKKNIEIKYSSKVTKINTDNGVIANIILNQIEELKVSGVFVYMGYITNSDLVKDFGIVNKLGYIEIDDKYMTKYNGVYAIGDLINKDLYQLVTAAADGARVINNIIK